MSYDPLPERFVPPSIIREAFNSGQFWERARRGEFTMRVRYNTHYSRRQARRLNYTYCTRSQTVRYFDDYGELVALVHQIRNPDGSVGASGKPDPKFLRLETEVLKMRR